MFKYGDSYDLIKLKHLKLSCEIFLWISYYKRNKKITYPIQSPFFFVNNLLIFNKGFVFVVCARLVINTSIFLDKFCHRFLLTNQKLWLASHLEMLPCFLCAILFFLQTLCLFRNAHMLSFKFSRSCQVKSNQFLSQKIRDCF